MRSEIILLTGLLTASVAMFAAAKASAADYGVRGEVFPVVETDLLGTIETRLHAMQASGKIDDVNRRLAARTSAKVKRPPRVEGIGTATETRVWTFDPSITAPENIFDDRGMLIVARGTRVNPLDHVPLRQTLVFLDGDDPAQVAWAGTARHERQTHPHRRLAVRPHEGGAAALLFRSGRQARRAFRHPRRPRHRRTAGPDTACL